MITLKMECGRCGRKAQYVCDDFTALQGVIGFMAWSESQGMPICPGCSDELNLRRWWQILRGEGLDAVHTKEVK